MEHPGSTFDAHKAAFAEADAVCWRGRLQVGLISEPLSANQAYIMHLGSEVVSGVDALQYWLKPTQVRRINMLS